MLFNHYLYAEAVSLANKFDIEEKRSQSYVDRR